MILLSEALHFFLKNKEKVHNFITWLFFFTFCTIKTPFQSLTIQHAMWLFKSIKHYLSYNTVFGKILQIQKIKCQICNISDIAWNKLILDTYWSNILLELYEIQAKYAKIKIVEICFSEHNKDIPMHKFTGIWYALKLCKYAFFHNHFIQYSLYAL